MTAKLNAPAADRNKDAILDVLRAVRPDGVINVLEVAAGTGQHAVHFAGNLPEVSWWPCELSGDGIASIAAYRDEAGLANLHPPQRLDVTGPDWAERVQPAEVQFILCCNMIHIAPWAACLGLLGGAGKKLGAGGKLMLYGPFRRTGIETAPSNEAFDSSLKARNPDWGLRLLEDVAAAARPHGLKLGQVIEMPANNLSVVFGKDAN